MTPIQFLTDAVLPGLALLPPIYPATRVQAEVQLVATGLQESRLVHRWQVIDVVKPETKGPARGLLQFERGGGVRGVMRHNLTREMSKHVCAQRGVEWDETAVWLAMEQDDPLSCAFGRMLILCDPVKLAPLGNNAEAFQTYLRCWNPGAFANGTEAERADLRRKWVNNYVTALATCSR